MLLLAAGQMQLLREVRRLKEASLQTIDQRPPELAKAGEQSRPRARVPGHRADSYENPPQGAHNGSAASTHPPLQSALSLAALEQRINELSQALGQQQGQQQQTPALAPVGEYNVMNPPPAPPPDPQTNPEVEPSVQKRSWGQEQVVGAPDTPTASDAPSAWASRDQDAGPEWLQLDFENAVDVAEVRIRESYNPGAISKVTGVVNGQEVVLWEGTAQGGAAPRDFVVPVQGNLQANSVVVHLDTARVPGWNEIDAVELVGKDGSRQWATSASASSTYAEPRQPQPQNQLGFDADGVPR